MENRKQSKASRHSLALLARAWETRWVIVTACAYLALFGWLFSAGSDVDIRPAEILVTPPEPAWSSPGEAHWFGTTGTGLDLFQLSHIAMAQTVALAALSSALGLALAFLAVMLFAFDPGERRFSLLKSFGRIGTMIPSALVLMVVLSGSKGGVVALVVTFSLLIAWHFSPILAGWFEESEKRRDIPAAYVLGLSRTEIVANRIVTSTLVALLEMALSSIGLGSERLSIGDLIAYGQDVIIEAPWLAIYPGIFATVVVMVMGALGWWAARLLRADLIKQIF